jgi:glycosyltransferase involved in cell wall biosynthesis
MDTHETAMNDAPGMHGSDLVEDPDVTLIVDRRVVYPAAKDGRTYWFEMPAAPGRIRLRSRHVVPIAQGIGQDARRLGVPVRRIICRHGSSELICRAEAAHLCDGFHHPGDGLRWTDGNADLPARLFAFFDRPFQLGIELGDAALAYPPRPRRALFIDMTTPTPDRDAGSNVALWHMRLLRDLGFDVTFVPEDNWATIPGYTQALHDEDIGTALHPRYRAIAPFLRDHGQSYDLVYLHRWEIAERCLPALQAYAPDAVVLFNPADLHFLRLQRAAKLHNSRTEAARAGAVRERELAVVAQVDCTLTCNTTEHALLQEVLPEARLHYLPWVIEPRAGAIPAHAARSGAMFLGSVGHPPNADGIQWFAREILPILRKLRPKLRLHLYGAGVTPESVPEAGRGFEISGYVPELPPVFDRHRALVAPLRFGAGFKGKIAEAMAHGVPVVATSIAAEGTGLVDGETMLVADTAAAFAEALARVDADADTWQHLSAAGHAYVAQAFSPERGREHLRTVLRELGREDLLHPA